METKSQVMDLNYLQRKVNQVRKSCVTPEQKGNYYRYAKLYRDWMKRYNNDLGYQIRVDLVMLIASSFLVALLLAMTSLFWLAKLINP